MQSTKSRGSMTCKKKSTWQAKQIMKKEEKGNAIREKAKEEKDSLQVWQGLATSSKDGAKAMEKAKEDTKQISGTNAAKDGTLKDIAHKMSKSATVQNVASKGIWQQIAE